MCRHIFPCRDIVKSVVANLHFCDSSFNSPCRSNEDFRGSCVCGFRFGELEGNDRLGLREVPHSHTRCEVAVNRLNSESVGSVGELEPVFPTYLDRGLLSESRLICPDLLVIEILIDNDVVALGVRDGVVLGKGSRLRPNVLILPGDDRGGIGAFEGEGSVGRASPSVRNRDCERIDRIKSQRIELFRCDRKRQRGIFRGVIHRPENLVPELLSDRERVPVCIVYGVFIGKAEVLVSEVCIAAGDGRGGVRAAECPRSRRRAALPICDDYFNRVCPEAEIVDGYSDCVLLPPYWGKGLFCNPVDRLRRRQDVAGVGIVDGVLDHKVIVLISQISISVRDQRVSVQNFKDGAETEEDAPRRGRAVNPEAGRVVPTVRPVRRPTRVGLLTPRIDADPVPKLIVSAVVIGCIHARVKVGRYRSRKSRDNLLTGDEAIPLVISRASARISVACIPIIVAACEQSAFIASAVDGDSFAGNIALPVEVVPRYTHKDNPVADQEGLVAVFNLDPLKPFRLICRGVADGVVRHTAGHPRDVSVSVIAACCVVRSPRFSGPDEGGSVVVKTA